MTRSFMHFVKPAAVLFLSMLMHGQEPAANSGYAPVDGLKMYYEIHGQGQSLILIHGGLGSGDMFSAILPELCKGREVITVDLQGHGHNADIDRPLSYQAMADDIAALLRYLKIARADEMGYSVGGEVALRTEIQHPGQLGATYVIPVIYVPALMITHITAFYLLIRPQREVARALARDVVPS
jgi:pimeloyl-ACP methyl ester carboxylesterase